MPYPAITSAQVEAFDRDGFIVIPGAMPDEDLRQLEGIARLLVRERERVAADWDWRAGEPFSERAFRIVQCGISNLHPAVKATAWRAWANGAASRLLGRDCEFWYDMFLGKPPRSGAPTPWHQDEAYWGRRLWDRGITCWLAPHDVDARNGCMHFVRGAHKRSVRPHRNPPEMISDLLLCDLERGDEVVGCPMPAGSVTFHHSRTPHMTTANTSAGWRLGITQHFAALGHAAEGDHYPWRVTVDQATGKRTRLSNGSEIIADPPKTTA